jgi:hypothetical protein
VIIHKVLGTQAIQKAADGSGYRFVISSEEPDLVNDIVVQAGMRPVSERIPAQVDHSGKMVDMIGTWGNLKTVGKKTFADLNLFEEGTSKMADMVRKLMDQKVRLGASIGFMPEEYEPIEGGGFKFLKSILHEVSVVVTPAHPEALSLAKSFGIDPERLRPSMSASSETQKSLLRAKLAIKAAERRVSTS